MRVAFYDHDTKGARIAAALADAGHQLVPLDADADAALIDLDAPTTDHAHLYVRHPRIVLYPHGANPILDWSVRPPHPNVVLNLVHAEGHAVLSRRLAPEVAVQVVGWSYSDLDPPRYPDRVERVLFAPAHTLHDGRIDPAVLIANAQANAILHESPFDVRVRRFEDGLHLTHSDIDAADLVVAEGTVAHLAAARGAPLLWIGADHPPDSAVTGPPCYPPAWPVDGYRYPHDIADAAIVELAVAACRPNADVDRWRRRWVGEPFDPHLAVKAIEEATCS